MTACVIDEEIDAPRANLNFQRMAGARLSNYLETSSKPNGHTLSFHHTMFNILLMYFNYMWQVCDVLICIYFSVMVTY